jgi:hypothetical protein
MADNVAISAGSGTSIAADDVSSVYYQRFKLSFGADGAAADANAANPFPVRGVTIVQPADASFTRPADTTAYAAGDLIANNTTAGSVTPMSFDGATLGGNGVGGTGRITDLILIKSGTAAVRVRAHFLKTSHAVTNGDNGALIFTSLDPDNYIGFMDVSFTGTDDGVGSGGNLVAKSYDPPLSYVLASDDTIYVFLEALSAWTPTSSGTLGARPTFEVLT